MVSGKLTLGHDPKCGLPDDRIVVMNGVDVQRAEKGSTIVNYFTADGQFKSKKVLNSQLDSGHIVNNF